MTSLEFLAGSAPAWIVAADLRGGTRARGGARTDRRSAARLGRRAIAAGSPVRLARPTLQHLPNDRCRRWRRRVALHLNPEDAGDDRALDALAELVEHVESLVLVLDERIALTVSAKADALTEVLHLREVLHPLPVDRPEHQVALDQRHELGADLLDLPVVRLRRRCRQVLDQGPPTLDQHMFRELRARLDRQVGGQVADQAVHVPVLPVPALATRVDALLDDVGHVGEDVRARVRALQHFAAAFVNDLALLVHHVVVLDHVLAGVEMHALDLLLGAGDGAGDPGMLDGFDLEAVHQPPDPIRCGSEDFHEVIFQRDEEPARARVALPARAPTQLVVDAPALVTLGTDDVQSPDVRDAWTQDDVGSTTRLVGADVARGGLPRLCDNRRLALVLLRVQDVVLHAAFLEHAREALRFLDRDRADQDWSPLFVHLRDLIDDRLELGLLAFVDDVGVVGPNHRPVGWDDHDVEPVDLVKLLGFGERGAGHPGELFVLPEVVLDRDRGDRLLLLLDLDSFFGLDRLVQAVRPAASGHRPARELVDDDHLAVLDQVFLVAPEQRLRLQRLVDLVSLDDVLEIVDVADSCPAFHLRDAGLGQ